jgi:hypothetical protein
MLNVKRLLFVSGLIHVCRTLYLKGTLQTQIPSSSAFSMRLSGARTCQGRVQVRGAYMSGSAYVLRIHIGIRV